MAVLPVLLFALLMASNSLTDEDNASGPSCTGVEDFEDCLGNTEEFCPVNISCKCKNKKPFCSCEYYRLDWKDYWYMGPKCNHLWNTLDFILVATLPAVGLVIIIVLIFSFVNCSKSKKAGKNTNAPSHEAQHNPAFTPETNGNLQHLYQPRGSHDWVGQIPKAGTRRDCFDDAPARRQLDNYSPMNSHPLRRPDSATEYSSNQRPQHEWFGYAGRDLPNPDYTNDRQYRRY